MVSELVAMFWMGLVTLAYLCDFRGFCMSSKEFMCWGLKNKMGFGVGSLGSKQD